MYTEIIQKLLNENGAQAAAIADYNSGLCLASKSNTEFDIELAAATATEIVQAEMKTMEYMDINCKIEDILITLTTQYFLMRPIIKEDGLFIYYVLNKANSNLALARRALLQAEKQF